LEGFYDRYRLASVEMYFRSGIPKNMTAAKTAAGELWPVWVGVAGRWGRPVAGFVAKAARKARKSMDEVHALQGVSDALSFCHKTTKPQNKKNF
jgi:hypothetical protein